MNYKKCLLYGLKSKKKLKELLHIKRNVYCKGSFVNCKVKPYIDTKIKPRIIEAPDKDLQVIQRRILRFLQNLGVPDYVFSGVKKRSYIDNAKKHSGNLYLYKTDISAFFPSITRNKVYNFYINKLKVSPDVANILTNFSTLNLNLKRQSSSNMKKVNQFLDNKNIKIRNHLITGSPLSCILSYLANVDMFEEIYNLSQKYNIDMTLYVDDLVFSANKKIPLSFKKSVLNIVISHGYQISQHKCKSYNRIAIKKVTGVVLDKKGEMKIPNSLMLKIHDYLLDYQNGDKTKLSNLLGCLGIANRINGKFVALTDKIKKQR